MSSNFLKNYIFRIKKTWTINWRAKNFFVMKKNWILGKGQNWQVKVFDRSLDALYQNLFFRVITLSFYEKKVGINWYKISTTQI